MSTTRKNRIIEGAKNLTKRKRNLLLDKHPKANSCFSRWFCKAKKSLIYPLETDRIDEKIPDFYFRPTGISNARLPAPAEAFEDAKSRDLSREVPISNAQRSKNKHFKALAHEKLGKLEGCFARGELSMVAYEYMMLGYTSILESRYMDAVAYLNKGLAWV